jgi:hypothetical protein
MVIEIWESDQVLIVFLFLLSKKLKLITDTKVIDRINLASKEMCWLLFIMRVIDKINLASKVSCSFLFFYLNNGAFCVCHRASSLQCSTTSRFRILSTKLLLLASAICTSTHGHKPIILTWHQSLVRSRDLCAAFWSYL